MLGLGAWELAMVLLVALVVLGPDKLPEVARKLARLVGQVRRVADDVRRNVDEAIHEHEVQVPTEPPKAAFTTWIEQQQLLAEEQREKAEANAAEAAPQAAAGPETPEAEPPLTEDKKQP